jgi:alpha-mannosidase
MTRRTLLQGSLLGSAAVAAPSPQADGAICVTLCNHWSYTGIGWQLGLESNVLSVVDAMELADRPPGLKTCINLDARAYELMAERFPDVTARLRKYLAEGKVELIGGTYGQPMGTMFSGESNIRQVVLGREVIRKALGYEMTTFLEEEEFTHPQVPQIVAGAGYKYASLAQLDTWGNAGVPLLDVNAFHWKGKDGTTILSTPKNSLNFVLKVDAGSLASSPAYRKLRASGKPLVLVWEEFGWESPEAPSYLTTPEKYKALTERFQVEFVTLREYLTKYGATSETVYFDMDSWKKLLTWGLGGDQLRILDRKVEALLLTAERFDAVAAALGAPSQAEELERAWRDLLASQSHDVGLCEYSRWQGDRMAPLDRSEDFHNFTWGAIGYNLLDAAEKRARPVLEQAVAHIARQKTAPPGASGLHVTVFNPCPWERAGIVVTGRIDRLPANTRDLVVRDRDGAVVPSQLLKPGIDGGLQVAFLARGVPGVGYDSYSLEPVPELTARPAGGLRMDESNLLIENEHIKVRLDPATGAVASLVDKNTGCEILAAPFPVFEGKPNPNSTPATDFGRRSKPVPEQFDSSSSKAEIDWVERGPIRASVRARHRWPLLGFETRVTLCAGWKYVEVTSRVLSSVPPLSDSRGPRQRFPLEIANGYWLSFVPGFAVQSVVRDFPLAIEPTRAAAFQALTFVDLIGRDRSLLVLHPGTQYFKRSTGGKVSNLIMREWESHFTGDYGWPRYAEYRHVLLPHGVAFTNADRMRASTDFSQGFVLHLYGPGAGTLPARKSFLSISPANVQLLAFHRKVGGGSELRVVEVEGQNANADIKLAVPLAGASLTDLIGNKIVGISPVAGHMRFEAQPWKIRTLTVDTAS